MASTGRDDGIGKYEIKKPSFLRRLMIEGLDAIPPGHTMMALLELDVTKARKALRGLRANGRKVSLFAFVIKAIATAVSENKELNSIRGAKGIVEFEDIDVNVPMELNSAGEKFPRQLVIRKAHEKSVERICQEVNEAREQFTMAGHAGQEDKWALNLMRRLFLVPKFLRRLILRALYMNPFTVKRMAGTIFVSSVGTFTKTPGFVVPYMGGPRAVSFILGSVVNKPVIVGGESQAREMLSMTIVFNHDIVDGAPAARFVNRLRKIVEGEQPVTSG